MVPIRTKLVAGFAALALVTAACGSDDDDAADEPADTTADAGGDDEPADSAADEPADSAADEPADTTADAGGDDEPADSAADEPADTTEDAGGDDEPAEPATGEPITLGWINIQGSAEDTTQELITVAAEAAIEYVNTELGGVDGRPLELEVCEVQNTPESTQACGNELAEMDLPLVLGGIDAIGDPYLTVFEQVGIPFLGSNPISNLQNTSPVSFMLGAGTIGAVTAFSLYVADTLEAQKVAALPVDLPPAVGAIEAFVSGPLGGRDISVEVVPIALGAGDTTPQLTAALASDPDAVFVLTPDEQCISVMRAIPTTGSDAAFFFPGNCGSQAVLETAGDGAEGAYIMGPTYDINDTSNEGVQLYDHVMSTYAPEDADRGGNAPSALQTVMAAYDVLSAVGGDNITAEAVLEQLRSSVDMPLVYGGTFTCDGQQVPGAPSLCVGSNVVFQVQDGALAAVSDPLYGPAILSPQE